MKNGMVTTKRLSQREVNHIDANSGRISLKFTPSDSLHVHKVQKVGVLMWQMVRFCRHEPEVCK